MIEQTLLGSTALTERELDWLTESAKGKKLIVEFGSLYGHSTIALAKSGATVVAVDDFYGIRESDMSTADRAKIFDMFTENTKDYKNIIPMRANHNVYIPPKECDMAFIDGDHQYESVKRDIAKFMSHHPILLCGHDYEWWPPVKTIVDELFPERQLLDSNLWYINL